MSGVDLVAWFDSVVHEESMHPTRAAEAKAISARAAVAELIRALAEMTHLAAGPVGGVTQAQKVAILNKARAALENAGGAL